MTARTKDKADRGAVHEIIDVARTIFYALLIALVLRVFLFQPFTIPSGSMKPNLLEGDYIVVTKFSYGYSRHSIPFSPPLFQGRIMGASPKQGDVVVFRLPDENKDLIKRVIGLPGDTVQVKGGVAFVNGKALPRVADGTGEADACPNGAIPQRFIETNPIGRQYATYDCGPGGDLDDTGVFVVPEGHYFFMGDNRDNSLDSRVPVEAGGVGYLPAENLIGRAQIILASWNGAALFKPWTWFLNLRLDRFFESLR
ncbi:MAG: signal peptidase I [Pseudomonadota bacterium]